MHAPELLSAFKDWLASRASTGPKTVQELVPAYFAWLDAEVAAGRNQPATIVYYHSQLDPWLITIPSPLPLPDVQTHHLTSTGGLTWHRIQAVQRLFRWARKQGFIRESPFADVEKPALGRRERILNRNDGARLMRACSIRPTRKRTSKATAKRKFQWKRGAAEIAGAPVRPLRWVLLALSRMGARPGEIRALKWKHYHEREGYFELPDFKAKRRRRDKLKARVLLVDCILARVLRTWFQRRKPRPDDFVFLNHYGKPWTKNAICQQIEHGRERAGLIVDDGEQIVAYTQRHTCATRAASPLDGSAGASLPQLASFLGHSTTRMTERYVHLNTADMRDVADKARARPKGADK